MKNDFITVIVPVYNAEKDIKRCIDSICNQTYKNLEIICVDDGSTDDSLSILQQYARYDKRMIVLHQENKGQSAARNLGIEHATGRYLFFCDSDDYLELHALEMLYDSQIKGFQLSVMKFYYENEKAEIVPREIPSGELSNNDIRDHFKLMYITLKGYFGPTLWNKLFCTDLIKKNDIKFYKSVIAEDVAFFTMYISVMETGINVIDYYGYYYMYNTSSLIRKNMGKSKTDSFVMLSDELYRFCNRNSPLRHYAPYFYYSLLAHELHRLENSIGLTEARNTVLDHKESKTILDIFKEYNAEYRSYLTDDADINYQIKEGRLFCQYYLTGNITGLQICIRLLNYSNRIIRLLYKQ